MKRVGIRELRQNASRYIRLVKAGETIEVTDRDVPVALITPLRPMSPRDQLIAEGKLNPGRQNWEDLVPLPAEPGAPQLSEILDELRADKI